MSRWSIIAEETPILNGAISFAQRLILVRVQKELFATSPARRRSASRVQTKRVTLKSFRPLDPYSKGLCYAKFRKLVKL